PMAEGVLESGWIVHFERDDGVGADRLEHRRHVARGDRIESLRPSVLARVAEVGRNSRYPRGTGVLQRPDEEQKSAELVVGAANGPAVQRLDNEDIVAVDALERAGLVLAVLELAFLVRGQRLAEHRRHRRAQLGGVFKRKKAQSPLGHETLLTAKQPINAPARAQADCPRSIGLSYGPRAQASCSLTAQAAPTAASAERAAPAEPAMSMLRQASSQPITSTPSRRASSADQRTQKSKASPAMTIRSKPRSRR